MAVDTRYRLRSHTGPIICALTDSCEHRRLSSFHPRGTAAGIPAAIDDCPQAGEENQNADDLLPLAVRDMPFAEYG